MINICLQCYSSLFISSLGQFYSINSRPRPNFCFPVRGEAGPEAWAPREQPRRRGRRRRGGRRRWRLWLRRRILRQSPLLWLHQAGPVLCDGDGTVRPAAQARSHRHQELPSGQLEVNHTRRTLPEEGRKLTKQVNHCSFSVHAHLLNFWSN